VIAPSGPVDPQRLHYGCALLCDLGLEIVLGTHVLDRSSQVEHLAGEDANRAADLERAWLDPDIAAVICARGGYGATRVLDHLDWAAMARAEPKILLGCSDSTALHQAFAAQLGVATLFGPMVATAVLGESADLVSLTALRTVLFEPERARVLTCPGLRTLLSGQAEGITTGGTLSLLAAGVGGPECRPATGGVVFIEDIDEAPYRIDQMLTQLLRSGWFTGVAAIVAGVWEQCGAPDEIDRLLIERLEPLDVPVLAGLDFGHGIPQLTVPLGVAAKLNANTGTVVLSTPGLL